jgi:hypothetical protein
MRLALRIIFNAAISDRMHPAGAERLPDAFLFKNTLAVWTGTECSGR